MAQGNHSALDSVSVLRTKEQRKERERLALAEDTRRALAAVAAGRGKRRM